MARPKQSGTRKATQYRAKPIEREREFDRAQSRMDRRIETYDDAMMGGDEDECASAFPSALTLSREPSS